MPFVNEYITEEEGRANRLDELHQSFRRWAWKDGRPPVFQHSWTIERERRIYLIKIQHVEGLGRTGWLEPTRREIFILNIHGNQAKVVLEPSNKSSESITDRPFKKVWKLVELDPPQVAGRSREEAIDILKEALTAYGSQGIFFQVPCTIVKFEF